jgi:arginyl-tRNA synthetase
MVVMLLLQRFQNALAQALTGLVDDPAPFAAQVKATQDSRHGDYQANCAMALSKVLGKPPREIAQLLKDRLPRGDWLEEPQVAGPGFLNFRLRSDWMAAQLRAMAADERLGVQPVEKPRTYVIDYSSPNVAKPMHVGHLRSTIIGDSLTRLLRFLGHTVITDNHLGDWGLQFGILLYGYKHFVNKEAFDKDPVQELARLYLHVRGLMKGEEDEDGEDPVAQACREETAKLHAGDEENRRLWQLFMPACYEEIGAIYRRLGVQFDQQLGESFYQPMMPSVVEDLERRGVAEVSQGAVVVFCGNREGEPPAIIRKRDGAFTYTTSDLATIRYRMEQWQPDAILYLVGFPQEAHFRNLFVIARRWGYDKVELTHVAFGSVLGATGRVIKTREGGAVTLEELLDEAVAEARKVYEQNCQESRERGEEVVELDEAGKRQIAEVVGIGAVKYADLSQNRTSDYTFSFDKMLAMNGNTATYMQYAYARNRSIFRKGNVDPAVLRREPLPVLLPKPEERALGLQLLRFQDALLAAAADYKPSQITTYLWDLAKTYSGFFQNCPVLKAETPELRNSRLLLCDLTARVIQRGLDLLGIRTVERM